MKCKIHYAQHLGLVTNRPARLINFYTKILGFKIEKESVASAKIMRQIFGFSYACKMVLLANDSARLELFSPINFVFNKRINAQTGFNHFSYIVEDKEKFCKSLARQRVPIIKVTKHQRYVYFIKDPDGNRIEIQN